MILSKIIDFSIFFENCINKKIVFWTFPDDDGTESRRKAYPGGISMKKYMMIILVIFGIFLHDFFFCSRGSVGQFLEFFRKKNPKNGRPGSRHPAPGPAAG